MQITLSTRDLITPDLNRLYRASKNRVAIHQAIAIGLVSIAKRAFTSADLRPSVWPNKTDGSPATLRKSGTLAKSIRAIATDTAATIATDRKYAAIHQLGGKTKAHIIRPRNGRALKTPFGFFKKVNHPGSKIPARPYMPFTAAARPTPAADRLIRQVLEKKLLPKK